MIKKTKLIAATAAVIALSYVISAYIIMQVPEVSIFSLNPQSVSSTVVCNGKLEYADSTKHHSEYNGIVSEVYVSEGDYVSPGDKLYSIEPQASDLSKAISQSQMSDYDIELAKNVLSGNTQALDMYDGEGIVFSDINAVNTDNIIEISSKTGGVISDIRVKSGNPVFIGENDITLSEPDKLQAKLEVGENKIGEIKTGQTAEIRCNAIDDVVMSGSVTKIDNVAKQTTTLTGKETTVEVIVDINKGITPQIKPGYTVKCSITVEKKDGAMLLPYDSIKYDDKGKEYVLCYSSGGICKKKNVTTGNEYKNGVEVISGISSNDFIISSPENNYENSFAKIAEEENE